MGNLGQTEMAGMQGLVAGMEAPAIHAGRVQVKKMDGEEHWRCSQPGCLQTGQYRLNGLRVCGRACLETLLRRVLTAEQAYALVADLGAGPRVQLGRILIEQGSISETQLERALRAQTTTGAGKLGSWLKQQVDLSDADFAAALSIQWRCPVFRLGNFVPRKMAFFLPRQLAEKRGAVALRITGETPRISVCFEDHVDPELLRAMEQMHGIPAEAGLLTATDFWHATRELLGVPFPRCASVISPSIDNMAQAMSHVLMSLEAPEARLVAMGDTYWLRVWQTRIDAPARSRPLTNTDEKLWFCGHEAAVATGGLNGNHALSSASQEVALDVLCTAGTAGDTHGVDLPGSEDLAQQMLGAAAERGYYLSD